MRESGIQDFLLAYSLVLAMITASAATASTAWAALSSDHRSSTTGLAMWARRGRGVWQAIRSDVARHLCVCVKMQLFRDTVCLYKPSQADDHDSRSAQACSFVQEMRL